jgi:hypothetical protein
MTGCLKIWKTPGIRNVKNTILRWNSKFFCEPRGQCQTVSLGLKKIDTYGWMCGELASGHWQLTPDASILDSWNKQCNLRWKHHLRNCELFMKWNCHVLMMYYVRCVIPKKLKDVPRWCRDTDELSIHKLHPLSHNLKIKISLNDLVRDKLTYVQGNTDQVF